MNLLKNNGWKCLWRGHPAQPTDQLKPLSKLRPCLSYSGRRDHTNSVLLRSFDNGGGGYPLRTATALVPVRPIRQPRMPEGPKPVLRIQSRAALRTAV